MATPFSSSDGGSSAASDVPDTIVGISFDDAFRAQEFYTAAMRLASRGDIELRDAVTIAKDANGKTFVRETVDPQPARSAMSGGLWAGFFGLLLGGPVGWVAGTAIGAGAGAVRARVVDLGIPDEWVAWFREAVQPGTFTLVLLLGRFDREATVRELERFTGAHLVYANLGTDGIARIRTALHDEQFVDDMPATEERAGVDAEQRDAGADEPATEGRASS